MDRMNLDLYGNSSPKSNRTIQQTKELRDQLHQARSSLSSAESEISTLKAQLTKAKDRADDFHEQVAEAKDENAELEAANAELAAKLSQQKTQLAAAKEVVSQHAQDEERLVAEQQQQQRAHTSLLQSRDAIVAELHLENQTLQEEHAAAIREMEDQFEEQRLDLLNDARESEAELIEQYEHKVPLLPMMIPCCVR